MQTIKDVERAIIKKFRKDIYSKVIRAVKNFELIEENDKIAVCISGGKDSFLMAKCMEEIKRHNKFNFELKYIAMNPGYEKEDITKLKELCNYFALDVEIFDYPIFDVVKDSTNPCFLCAKMRRGALYNKAKELGCNKIALGHHFNDVIETILLNQIYNGNFSGMLPKLNSDHFEGMQLIRPLFYVKEKDILSFAKYTEVDYLNYACKWTKNKSGKRLEMKKLTILLVDIYKNADINIMNSMYNVNPNTTKIKKD